MRRSVDETEGPADIADPGFVYPIPYLKRTFSWLENYGVMPEPGALNDQPKAWVEDMELLAAMKGQVRREYQKWLEEKSDK